jgi:hypothetical protein
MMNAKLESQCLEALIFTPIVKNVLVRYTDGMVSVLSSLREIFKVSDTVFSSARTKYHDLAMRARAEVEKAITGTDTSGLRASFDHSFSLSIPPLSLYCNYRPDAFSDLIFGLPLVNPATSQDIVPKVIRMCIEEVEKRGLDTPKIYPVSRSSSGFGFMFTVAGGFYIQQRHTAGEWKPPNDQVLADANSHSVAAQV